MSEIQKDQGAKGRPPFVGDFTLWRSAFLPELLFTRLSPKEMFELILTLSIKKERHPRTSLLTQTGKSGVQ